MKRQRAIDLLCTQVDPKVITTQIKVSLPRSTNIRKAKEGLDPISRKPGTGGHNKKRSGEFLNLLQEKSRRPHQVHEEDGRRENVALTPSPGPSTRSWAQELRQDTKASLAATMKARSTTATTVKIYSDKKIFIVGRSAEQKK
ncbi:Uncharacterized protein FKW44_005742 [Caligus rogercresseyi]|uniref:Uncharacterized protein n=1 Tax=Caligus rogercresseyi TaxID=217165 RepID=A0A7T8KCF2_CALRO|nr:Uncharacterized protein FKW44_005742 [Caligus rogercresseyi]